MLKIEQGGKEPFRWTETAPYFGKSVSATVRYPHYG